jgi:hypothetical protein
MSKDIKITSCTIKESDLPEVDYSHLDIFIDDICKANPGIDREVVKKSVIGTYEAMIEQQLK